MKRFSILAFCAAHIVSLHGAVQAKNMPLHADMRYWIFVDKINDGRIAPQEGTLKIANEYKYYFLNKDREVIYTFQCFKKLSHCKLNRSNSDYGQYELKRVIQKQGNMLKFLIKSCKNSEKYIVFADKFQNTVILC